MTVKNNFYILTGGPGSGKTTLIEQLGMMGYDCIPETGRKIIQQQLSSGGTALPWADKAEYSRLMLQHSVQDYLSQSTETDVRFFDRGIPDVLGYTELIGLPDREIFIKATENFRYNSTVFILPPWLEIYKTDAERKQSPELAATTYHMMKAIYERYHYKLVEIPRTSVAERIRFILDRIG